MTYRPLMWATATLGTPAPFANARRFQRESTEGQRSTFGQRRTLVASTAAVRGAKPIGRPVLPVAAAVIAACLLGFAAAPATAAQRCPNFKLRPSQAAGALAAGRYAVSPVAGAEDPCAAASTVVQSYLYDPPTFRRWTVHRLVRGRGVRFVLGRHGVSVTARRRGGGASVAVARSPRGAPVARAAETHVCTIFQVVHNAAQLQPATARQLRPAAGLPVRRPHNRLAGRTPPGRPVRQPWLPVPQERLQRRHRLRRVVRRARRVEGALCDSPPATAQLRRLGTCLLIRRPT
jgi:hypothetical protein